MSIKENLFATSPENPLLRKLMSKEEIKIANKLVKDGKLIKGISNDKQKSIIYYAK